MAVVGALGIGALEVACATAEPPKPLTPLDANTPNSVVLPSGERVCDISGDWDAEYSGYEQEVEFTQTKDGSFSGRKTKGGIYVLKGQKTIRVN
jgi:hypothetical protein|tara:strand:+ start:53 stop:334 length:282 start_codon:yes stop_codon:yes gene_type:complete